MPQKQKRIFIIACITLVLVFLLILGAIFFKSPPPIATPVIKARTVEAKNFKKDTQAVQVKSYGTAEAEYHITVKAPLRGEIFAHEGMRVGQVFPANTPLYFYDPVPLDLKKKAISLRLRDIEIEITATLTEKKSLEIEIDTSKELMKLAQQQVEESESSLESQKEIFSTYENLKSTQAISNNDFLKEKLTLDKIELQYLSENKAYLKSKEAVDLLEMKLDATHLKLEQNKNKVEQLKVEQELLEVDIAKSSIQFPYPVAITEVLVNKKEDVREGETLAKVISIDSVLITTAIPDHVFQWIGSDNNLYHFNPSVKINWLSASFEQGFDDGKIVSIGKKMNEKTRSLPIVVERKQIPGQAELKPGAYCELTFKLSEVENAFKIPSTALQEYQRLYIIEDGTLRIIENVDVLHESEGEILVSLPDTFDEITLVIHKLNYAKSGTLLKVAQ